MSNLTTKQLYKQTLANRGLKPGNITPLFRSVVGKSTNVRSSNSRIRKRVKPLLIGTLALFAFIVLMDYK